MPLSVADDGAAKNISRWFWYWKYCARKSSMYELDTISNDSQFIWCVAIRRISSDLVLQIRPALCQWRSQVLRCVIYKSASTFSRAPSFRFIMSGGRNVRMETTDSCEADEQMSRTFCISLSIKAKSWRCRESRNFLVTRTNVTSWYAAEIRIRSR